MRRPILLISTAMFVMALAACNADRSDTPSADADPATAATPEPAPAAEGDTRNVTMRYTCDGDHAVAVHGDASVIVTMADGSTELPRVADSAPPQFADDTLSFSINAKGAELGHVGVGTFACQPE